MSGTLTDEIEDFRAKISKIVDTLEDISTSSIGYLMKFRKSKEIRGLPLLRKHYQTSCLIK